MRSYDNNNRVEGFGQKFPFGRKKRKVGFGLLVSSSESSLFTFSLWLILLLLRL